MSSNNVLLGVSEVARNGGSNDLLNAALEYAASGWPVLPLHSPMDSHRCSCGKPSCTSIGKHPRTEHGVLGATTDEPTIRSWWQAWPDANIGLACGNGRVVVDVDDSRALEEFEAQYGTLPVTPRQQTGKGLHLVFSSNGAPIGNKVRFAPCMDLRADGGYIVAAPSRHANGAVYTWVVGLGYDEIEPAPLPEAIVSLLAAADKADHEPLDPIAVLAGVSEGARNQELFRYACRLLGYNKLTAPEVRFLVLAAAHACKPPMENSEVEAILRSASKYREGDADGSQPAWPPLIPFDTPTHLPPFPLDALPLPLRAMAQEIAATHQVPIDLAAVLVLGVASAAAARSFRVHVGNTHTEPPNIYVVAALPSGERKSAAFKEATQPLEAYEEHVIQEKQPTINRLKERRTREEARLKKLRDDAVKSNDPDKAMELGEDAEQLAETLTEVPVTPQLLAADATPEALTSLLAEQGGTIAVLAPEGGGVFDVLGGRYSQDKKPNFDVYLSGYDEEPIRVNRQGRVVRIPRPRITAVLTVQPDVIRGLAVHKEFEGRGFLGRWAYILPASLVGHRENPTGPSRRMCARSTASC